MDLLLKKLNLLSELVGFVLGKRFESLYLSVDDCGMLLKGLIVVSLFLVQKVVVLSFVVQFVDFGRE